MIAQDEFGRELVKEEASSLEDKSKDSGGFFRGDGKNFAIFLTLYSLQGVALGLTNAMPVILQNKHVTYGDQASFSFCGYPFAAKLLWAPVLDVVYSARFGKRKSWLVPSQILLGLLLLFISANFDHWLVGVAGKDGKHHPDTVVLGIAFFAVNFLTATQDIALDGWALTIIQRRNVRFVGTYKYLCLAIGSTVGNNVFIILESADLSNRFLRSQSQPTGILSFPTFIRFWALVFLVTTFIVAIFKKETYPVPMEGERNLELSLFRSYKLAYDILRLKPVLGLAILLFFGNVAFAPNQAVGTLKMVDSGFTQEKFALLGIAVIPVQIFLPLCLKRFILNSRPLSLYVYAIPFRLFTGIFGACVLYVTKQYTNGDFDVPYYILVDISGCLDQIGVDLQSIPQFAFMTGACDPRCGATYMALLATVANLGTSWSSSAALALVDFFTLNECVRTGCVVKGTCFINMCSTYLDGYYVETAICTLFGLVWLLIAMKVVDYLHKAEPSKWLVDNSDLNDLESRHADYNEISVVVEPSSSTEDTRGGHKVAAKELQ